LTRSPVERAEPAPQRVLLVDDEISSTEVLALILAGEGMHVTVAADGRQALQRLEEAAPDLLITDFMMPGMNGADLIARVRAVEAFADVKVLVISGAPEAALRSYRMRFDAFLRKPFELDRFLSTVKDLLDPPSNAPSA
jgi:CheY-like chemotaxis protein